jgi:hypothetical protein
MEVDRKVYGGGNITFLDPPPKNKYIGDIYTKYLWVLDPGLHVDKDPVSNIHFCRIIRRPTYVPSSITWAGLLRAHPFGSQAYWRDNSKSGYVLFYGRAYESPVYYT